MRRTHDDDHIRRVPLMLDTRYDPVAVRGLARSGGCRPDGSHTPSSTPHG